MTNFFRTMFNHAAVAAAAVFCVWLLMARHTSQENYLQLTRVALLFLGILVIAYGTLWLKPNMIGIGLALLLVGYLCFFVLSGPNQDTPAFSQAIFGDSMGWKVQQGLRAELFSGRLTVGHLAAVAFLVANGILIRRGAHWHHFLGANVILTAFVILAALLVP